MPSVHELSAPYENVMLGPRRGPDVCGICFNFTAGFARCYACAHGHNVLDAIAPISYSVGREQLHHALASYKRLDGEVARRLGATLAAILWRFLAEHERCIAQAAETDRFHLITTVPSSDQKRDERHPLRHIVGALVGPTRTRHARLLRNSDNPVPPRTFSEDTWTTGSSAQSAAAALKHAGAGPVAAVVIGRHLNREWHENDRRLRGIARPFNWAECAVCAEPVTQPLHHF